MEIMPKKMLCLENEFQVYFHKSSCFKVILQMCLLIHMEHIEHMESTQMLPILEDLEERLGHIVTHVLHWHENQDLQLASTMIWQLQMHAPLPSTSYGGHWLGDPSSAHVGSCGQGTDKFHPSKVQEESSLWGGYN